MFLIRSVLLFTLFFNLSLRAQTEENRPWSGHILRLGLGNVFDFELPLHKGDGYPSSAMIRWGYEYGYQFPHTKLYLGGALDWTITYPRNFYIKGAKIDFFTPPVALWYTPMTNIQLGWAFDDRLMATVGVVYLWGLSNSLRYRPHSNLFFEFSSIIWIDRILNARGYYGEGFDNLHLSAGIGYQF